MKKRFLGLLLLSVISMPLCVKGAFAHSGSFKSNQYVFHRAMPDIQFAG